MAFLFSGSKNKVRKNYSSVVMTKNIGHLVYARCGAEHLTCTKLVFIAVVPGGIMQWLAQGPPGLIPSPAICKQ